MFLMIQFTGGGKSRADTYSAITKKKVDQFVRQGGKADTARRFAQAIVSESGVANVTCHLGKIIGEVGEPNFIIDHLRDYHQFIFLEEGMVARRVPSIGEGVFIEMDGMEMDVDTIFDGELMNNPDDMVDQLPRKRTSKPFVKPGTVAVEPMSYYEEQRTEDVEVTQNTELFRCEKNSLCSKKFIREHNFLNHMNGGSPCIIRVVHPTRKDLILAMNVEDNGLPDINLETEEASLMILELQKPSAYKLDISLPMENTNLYIITITLVAQCPMGDGLPIVKTPQKYHYDTHVFIVDIFKKGEKTGHPIRAHVAATMMRNAKNPDGSFRFQRSQWKSEAQVTTNTI